ncbi:CDP-alcohol phosphatidyltransferase family protein [Methanoplanus sp. FWC-SCC4]|uniref:CDP-alcohol phosphatidyltransferase family protein n=1 Tax=Methanochimaera problematica TaxID=2609417 RepID=A0AA97I3M0_9EURY|nr:CDP-alcohol phosphatidyltransferase family protein [Methanoplanus sp. FWC-SCC4]WOF15376.1 CDP-alcohol phosphatidyltransferase family protein [Methanoplanus sp. FWC-SCC4]
MTLDNYRPHVAGIIKPIVKVCVKLHLTPNASTIIAFIAAAAAGYAFYQSNILMGVIFVFLNAFFDAIDGAIAREMNIATPGGDFLDHVIDRYADIFIICGIFAGPLAPWPIGVFALTGVLMSSYLGTQAQAVGVGRFYGGILGRADRLVLLIAAGIIDLIVAGGIYGMSFLGWLLVVFGVLGHFTAAQRFAHVWKELKK